MVSLEPLIGIETLAKDILGFAWARSCLIHIDGTHIHWFIQFTREWMRQAGSHVDFKLKITALKHHPHALYVLQSLDVTGYRPLKQVWRHTLKESQPRVGPRIRPSQIHTKLKSLCSECVEMAIDCVIDWCKKFVGASLADMHFTGRKSLMLDHLKVSGINYVPYLLLQYFTLFPHSTIHHMQ